MFIDELVALLRRAEAQERLPLHPVYKLVQSRLAALEPAIRCQTCIALVLGEHVYNANDVAPLAEAQLASDAGHTGFHSEKPILEMSVGLRRRLRRGAAHERNR